MKKLFFSSILSGLKLIGLSTLITHASNGAVGQIAQNFSLPFFDSQALNSNESFSLYEQQGSVLVLEWFGWWCPFCPPAAAALEDEVLVFVQDGNANGVPVKHIALHVEGADLRGINDFISRFGFTTVVMDVQRQAMGQFTPAGTQPFILVLNGVANAEGIQQWEVLFEHNGYGGASFPGSEILAAVNSVRASSTGAEEPGGPTVDPEVIPDQAPAMDGTQPFATLPLVEGLKEVGGTASHPWSVGKIWDNHYPYVYSFSLAASQAGLDGTEQESSKGWFYIFPQLTSVGDGLLIYVFGTGEWRWLPRARADSFQNLNNTASGVSGWVPLPAIVDAPSGEELTTFLAGLTVPASPPALGAGNPFAAIAAVDGQKSLVDAGFPSLGSVDDSRFPIVKSSLLEGLQTGASKGWIYILPELSNMGSALFAYLYDEERWAWLPNNAEPWGFRFTTADGLSGNGWSHPGDLASAIPTAEELAAFNGQQTPGTAPTWGTGNPFGAIVAEDGAKNANAIGTQNFGWVTDQRYPGVYRFEDSQDSTTENRWFIFNDAATLIAGGIWAPMGQLSTTWFPLEGTSRSVSLDGRTGGFGGWNSAMAAFAKPDLDTINASQLLEIPTVLASTPITEFFQGLAAESGVKNTEGSAFPGLGWVSDVSFPNVYSFKLAAEQTQTVDQGNGSSQEVPLANAGWFYVQTDLSSAESGLLIYLYATDSWRWYPAGGSGWFFDLSSIRSGNSGWSLFEVVAE